MAKMTKSPNARLNKLYELLELNLDQLGSEGAVYIATSTQGEQIPKQNPRWKTVLEILQEIRLIEIEQGKTALGRERRKKLAAEAKKLEAEASAIDAPKSDAVADFLAS